VHIYGLPLLVVYVDARQAEGSAIQNRGQNGGFTAVKE
jgi:hypothetical protein